MALMIFPVGRHTITSSSGGQQVINSAIASSMGSPFKTSGEWREHFNQSDTTISKGTDFQQSRARARLWTLTVGLRRRRRRRRTNSAHKLRLV